MDLNYLYYRQQIETSMAEAAHGGAARKVHGELAKEYEEKISEAVTRAQPKANETMALAITAREVGKGNVEAGTSGLPAIRPTDVSGA
jgi:hypothetical protein